MFKFIRSLKDRLTGRKLKKTSKEEMIFPAKFAGYDPQIAVYLAKISEWTYPKGEAVSTDYETHEEFLLDMEKKKKKALEWGFREFSYVYAEDIKILALILREGPNMIISFRGTVIDCTINWQMDLQARIIPMESFGGVHKGFSEALDSIWAGIKNHISTRKCQRIWITGHSLGGALALLTGARLITEYRKCPNVIINGLYTFAAPRIGDRDFADSYKNTYLGKRTFIFIHYNDIVTALPPSIQKISEYENVGNILYIEPDGTINPVECVSEFKIIRQFLTGYFKEQFLAGFNKEKLVHDWQTFENFFAEVFTELKPSISTPWQESEHWIRFKNFFTRENEENPAQENKPAIESNTSIAEDLENKDLKNLEGDEKEPEEGKLASLIWELFAELFVELNPYVVESHGITTYIKSLEKPQHKDI
ncbi:MAG: lipase family protein [Acidobacteria bacterium]|jgi:triacylglycerol lipase|nr:lipase family protein [Acidobacteriota bacterium]